jgi:hypothetical protein
MRGTYKRKLKGGEGYPVHIPRIFTFSLRFMSEASRAAMPFIFAVLETEFPSINDTAQEGDHIDIDLVYNITYILRV